MSIQQYSSGTGSSFMRFWGGIPSGPLSVAWICSLLAMLSLITAMVIKGSGSMSDGLKCTQSEGQGLSKVFNAFSDCLGFSQLNKIHSRISNVLVIGGVRVTADDPIAKRTVGLVSYKKNPPGSERQYSNFSCTASIISRYHLLTAAHCFVDIDNPESKFIAFFDTRIDNAPKSHRYNIRRSDITLHPNYETPDEDRFGKHDIAIVKFNVPIPPGYEPIELIDSSFMLKMRDQVTVAGYGVTEIAFDDSERKGDGSINKIDLQVMTEKHRTVLLRHRPHSHVEDGPLGGICFGDSGGPLVVKVDDSYKLVGVAHQAVRKSKQHKHCSWYSVWTKTTAYRDFIDGVLAAN